MSIQKLMLTILRMFKTKTQLETLSEWIEQIRFEDIPPKVIELAKLQTMDCIAAICAGSRSEIGKNIYTCLKRKDQGGNFSVLPHHEKWTFENAVYYHSSMINALEMDNFSFMGHLSQSAFSSTWSLSEKLQSSGKDFLQASIVAQEISGRLSAYLSSGPLQGHMRSYIHRIASAVVVAKLYNCKANVIAHAMAIALSGPEYFMLPSSFSADTKVSSTSSATLEGIRSAYLAMEGMKGTLDIIEHPAGFVSSFSYLNYIPNFWQSIGKTWVMESISFKYYASCAYAQAPVNAVIELKKKHLDLNYEQIKKVIVKSPILSVIMENYSKPHYNSGLTQVNINFSTKRSVALALIFGSPDGTFYGANDLAKKYKLIDELSRKIEIKHSWKLSIDMIRGFDQCITNPGYPGVFGMSDSNKALKKTQAIYENRSLFEVGDIKQFIQLPKGDFKYLAKRYLNALKGKYIYKDKRSAESDLAQLQFKVGAELQLILLNGETITHHCPIPKGFAGDSQREISVKEKYFRETIPVLGQQKSQELWNWGEELENKVF